MRIESIEEGAEAVREINRRWEHVTVYPGSNIEVVSASEEAD